MRFSAVRIGGHDSYGLRVFEGFKTGPAGELINVGRIAKSGPKGFTLVEILLVVVIIGIILAVVVPRAWRANVDAKYNLVRQAGTELGSYAMQWAEKQIAVQGEELSISLYHYFSSLSGSTAGTAVYSGTVNPNNWNQAGPVVVNGNGGDSFTPSEVVENLVPPEKLPLNPFNGASYFASSNGGDFLTPGLLACASAPDSGYTYFAFVFTGTDSGSLTDFHGGQSVSLEGLKNGVFIARAR